MTFKLIRPRDSVINVLIGERILYGMGRNALRNVSVHLHHLRLAAIVARHIGKRWAKAGHGELRRNALLGRCAWNALKWKLNRAHIRPHFGRCFAHQIDFAVVNNKRDQLIGRPIFQRIGCAWRNRRQQIRRAPKLCPRVVVNKIVVHNVNRICAAKRSIGRWQNAEIQRVHGLTNSNC